ncbi:hypothetical protein K470DRAFT_295241 [Piedraia hortae CBS 480.64]|uniref:RRM domain-containing protein n=1 Tax=Piedraia hortae CBS 480.64 TaxID=1314780 RepID=A0A6A7BXL8_9PEZI|nr:hypothetical protein K470DRAFT_295241 [Piedraia hortae CBS 480.64]
MPPKKKAEKMALGAFMSNQALGSWADEMESMPIPAPSTREREAPANRSFTQPAWGQARNGTADLGTGGRDASYDRPQFSDREQLPMPTRPPFTAHLGNLTYDVTSVDIEEFFQGCHVTSVRIVEDKIDRKPKGFGYVEFATLDDLKSALDRSESNFMGRNIKISVAEPLAARDRAEGTRDISDWTRKGPLPALPMSSRQSSHRGFSRNLDNTSDAGSDRGGRKGFFDDGKVRDLQNWERKGPLSPVPGTGPPVRDGGRLREGERKEGASWGEGRSESSRPRPAAERVPTAAELDNQWRSKMRPDPSPVATPDASAPASPASREAPKERPRLKLAKRTISTTNGASPAASPAESKASPFGAARPIDTAAREREIEEKRLQALKQKQEADQKVKEQKSESKPTTASWGPSSRSRNQHQNQNGLKPQTPKENDEKQPVATANREEVATTTEGTKNETSEASNEQSVSGANSPQTEEGWSTVASKGKGNRRGH